MSEAFKDGGPAYPMADPFVVSTPKNVDEAKRLAQGMSLRDHFAGLAMQGFLSGAIKGSFGVSHPDQNMNVALASFAIADAMLSARQKESS